MRRGWTPETVERARSAPLPQKIKCSGCQIPLPQASFTESQLAKLRNKIAMHGQVAIARHIIRCQSCTGGGVPGGITCVRCHVSKPIDSYTKVQRRDSENATCKTCVSEVVVLEPWSEMPNELKEYRDDQLSSVSDSNFSVANSRVGGVTLPSAPREMGAGSIASQIVDYESLGGGVWIEPRTGTARPKPETSPLARDATSRDGTSAASFSGWQNTTFREHVPSPLSNGVSTSDKPENRTWAKIKSHDPSRTARILRMSDPVKTVVPMPVSGAQNDSDQTVSGTKIEKKFREELGDTKKRAA